MCVWKAIRENEQRRWIQKLEFYELELDQNGAETVKSIWLCGKLRHIWSHYNKQMIEDIMPSLEEPWLLRNVRLAYNRRFRFGLVSLGFMAYQLY